MRFSDLQTLGKILRTAAIAIGCLLSFFAVIEILRAYLTLREINAALGIAFLVILATAISGFIIYIIRMWGSVPPVLQAPHDSISTNDSSKAQVEYFSFLIEYARRLANNNEVELSHRQLVKEFATNTQSSQNGVAELSQEIARVEKEIIEPVLQKLDDRAEREIRDTVRDVMLGVTLSPFRAADLFIVLYRNILMVTRIVRIYNSRPQFREMLSIMVDVFKVVATVNFLNFGEKFIEQLLARVPLVGQVIDDLAQGVGAGLMTSATGHAAITRCRTYQRWEKKAAIQNLASHLREFLQDVSNIFRKDIMPRLFTRIRLSTPEKEWDSPGFREKITNGIASAFEGTVELLDSFVKKPIIAASKSGVTKAGSAAVDMITKGSKATWKAIKKKPKSPAT